MPKSKREAISAVYAFCRVVDDIVDSDIEPSIAATKINWWYSELDAIYNAQASHPIACKLVRVVKEFSIPKEYFSEILSGMTMDLQYQGYAEFKDLELYCHRVASVVGMIIATILGYTNTQTLEYAKNLGMCFQIINIVRDVGEDARRNRVYLAEEDLARFGLKADDLLSLDPVNFAKLHPVLSQYAAKARAYYKTALELLPKADRRAQSPGLIMANIYLKLLSEIENSNFAVLNSKISLAPAYRLWVALQSYWQERRLCHQLS